MSFEKIEEQRVYAHRYFPRMHNWDGEGGQPVSPVAINLAADIAKEIYIRFGYETTFNPGSSDGAIVIYVQEPYLGNVFSISFDDGMGLWRLDWMVKNIQTGKDVRGSGYIAEEDGVTPVPQESLIWERLRDVMYIDYDLIKEAHDLAQLDSEGRLTIDSARKDDGDDVRQRINKLIEGSHRAEDDILWGCVVRLPSDYEPWGNRPDVERGTDCSCGCKWFRPLDQDHPESTVGMDWGVCTNPNSPRSGMLTWEHQGSHICFEQDPDDTDDRYI